MEMETAESFYRVSEIGLSSLLVLVTVHTKKSAEQTKHTKYKLSSNNGTRVEVNKIKAYSFKKKFTEGLCTEVDSAIEKLTGQCFNLKNEELSAFNKIRIHLPIFLNCMLLFY